MWKYVAVLVGFYLLQQFMAYRQMIHFKDTILAYRKQGVCGLGVRKSRLGFGKVVFLVSDASGRVVVARMMSGMSVFARFRAREDFVGTHVDALLARPFSGKREAAAVRQAAEQILAKLRAGETPAGA